MLALLAVVLALFEAGAWVAIGISRDPGLRRVARDFPDIERRMAWGFRFIPDPELGYRLRRNYRVEVDGVVTHHNAQGFRGARDFEAKAPGTFRILCIGGSTTYGAGVDADDATYPAYLERELHRRGLDHVEVLNLGVGGYTTVEVLGTLRRQGPALDPDLVLVQCAVNDVPPRFYPGFDCDYAHFRVPLKLPRTGPVWRAAYHSRLFLAIGYETGFLRPLTLQDRTQPPWPPVETMHANLERNGPACFRGHLAEILDAVGALGARPVLLTQAYLEHRDFQPTGDVNERFEQAFRIGLAEHTEAVRELARERAVPLVDLAAAFPALRRYFTDPIHMAETGNAEKARRVAAVVAPLVEAMRRQTP